MYWYTPIQYLSMVGPVYAKRLEKINILTVGDLLTHLPFRYEDYSVISQINNLEADKYYSVIGEILEAKNVFTRNRKQIQILRISDGNAEIEAIWFNQPFIIRNLSKGQKIALSGKIIKDKWKLIFQSPEYEIVREHKPLLHTARFVPIYPETAGVSSKWLRSRIFPILNSTLTTDFLPPNILKSQNLINLQKAFSTIHFPEKLNDIIKARERLAFDELFILQLQARINRNIWQKYKVEKPMMIDKEKVDHFIYKLPFQLTTAQNKVINEIFDDLSKSQPMNRLLEGDVGSGKTIVATLAAYVTFLNHKKTLIMAPTEILAQQHYATLKQLLEPFGIKIGLITGSIKSTIINQQSAVNILVGTHALLENSVNIPDVGLVIIDEQHRFGVRQRSLLRKKGASPHVLTMTATPIPRTVALTIHGDLDLSIIDEMPQNRKPIKTWVVPPQKRNSAYMWITKQIKSSNYINQVFIVCPFIEISESMSTVKAASEEYKKLQNEVFPDLKLGLLHGKLKIKEKNSILQNFRDKKINILVSTPVVEVGIDIPDATIMLIEAAERFGLAQLHQLRGRVGRGNAQSFCLLFTTNTIQTNLERLTSLEKDLTGFQLAELDLRLRGAGQVYGLSQHGESNLKIATFNDKVLLAKAQTEANKLLLNQSTLVDYPLLKQRLFSGKIQDIVPD